MSDGPTLAQILLSGLGSPTAHSSEIIGCAIILLILLAYIGVEIGLAVVLRKLWRAIATGATNRDDRP